MDNHWPPPNPRIEYQSYDEMPRTSGKAVIAFILSLFMSLIGCVIALYLGYSARNEIDRSYGRLDGRGFATAAIWISWIVLALLLIGVTRA